ncbi:DUF349 domain-containing protein [Hymenobacter edaphi]|uniref:DUF349 domain-containing protein n=1 Tax=Hymenobacter edaphi TaxID=2211146 RepID=A0A328BTV1_9BACT|nr:DUF349 domain-containing protein [Hymenobacter edaphi]RAK70105.1 DUF349 domain-containing protein [Hymenobacter edaphi]
MQPENETPNRPESNQDNPMSILERRLAEIAQSRQQGGPAADAPADPQPQPATAPAQPAAPAEAPAGAASEVPHAAARPDVDAAASPSAQPAAAPSPAVAAEDITEHADHSAPAAIDPTAEPGTAGTEPTPVVPAETGTPTAEAASSPAAADYGQSAANKAFAEQQQAEASQADAPSAAQQRAEQHYGNEGPGAVAQASETNPPVEAIQPDVTPAPATEPVAVTLPAQPLASAEALEDAPAPLAALPTSNNESAAEAAHAAEHVAPHPEDDEDYVPETPAPDFAKLDPTAQGAYLLELLRRPDARQNRRQILDLHRQYEQGVGSERGTARQRFTEAGNNAEDFSFSGPEHYAEVTRAMQDYRDARVRDARQEDEQRAKNLAHKQHLLSQLRQLVESAETKDSSARIKTLQAEWKATGPVPQQQSQELWNSYHALLDIYYNNRGLFFEMKELDRRRNQEAKEALIKRAEDLVQQPSINKALTELRQLHEEWKGVGPVPNEMREPLWQRFLQASEQVHNRKRAFVDARSAQENANLQRKQELLAQILPFGDFKTERVNEWRAKTDELQTLKEQWDAAGLVPRSQAETMNKQFWASYKGFFQHKNQFFKALDEEKNRNLKAKIALCEQAEAALENPNWEEGREVVIRVQKEWKNIGRVPEKQSDKIWHRFRTACDSFFERKQTETRQREHHQQQLSQEQAARLDGVASHIATLSEDNPGTQEGLQALVAEWSQSEVPQPGRRGGSGAQAEEKFLELMSKYIDTIPGLSYAERDEQRFQLEVQRLKSNPEAQQLLYRKEQNLRRDINELENDVATLQTNLDFFARSKNAGQLREEYQGRIDEAKQRIERLKRQLRVVRS